MGEAKEREAAMKAAMEEQKKRQEELQKLLSTPMTKDEAEKALADAAVDAAQLLVARQKLVARQDALRVDIAESQARIDEIDTRLQEISLSKSIVFRRTLNVAAEQEPAMGEPVKTN